MTKPIAVVALGGNAILDASDDGSFETQLEKAKDVCRQLLTILHRGYQLILVHGNGPQVGNLLIQFEKARDTIPVPPLDVAVASSQGLLGHMLEISMRSALEEARMQREVASVLTQVVVSQDDPAFDSPTKPIGPFYTEEQAREFMETEGWHMIEDSGRGWRRVVCSPLPRKILEMNTIKHLAENDTVVIACGGGGTPVNYLTDSVVGTEGVIDKDATAALLAYNVGAELFIILTGVDKVCVNFGKPDQQSIDCMNLTQARDYLDEGQFPAGSMGPKIASAVEYVEKGGQETIITSKDNIVRAMEAGNCTRIVR